MLPASDPHLIEAVIVGGVMGCTSALQAAGVFVGDSTRCHIHVAPHASRLRRATSRPRNEAEPVIHWDETRWRGATSAAVSLSDALAKSLQCQSRWESVATFDSALHLGLVSRRRVEAILRTVAPPYRDLGALLDPRAESGPESILRMIVTEAGLRTRLQVTFPGVGRVDMVVEGCVVVEADSRLAHDGWEHHVRDRGRDLALARLGMPSLRPSYQHIMHAPGDVAAAVVELVRTVRGNAR